MPLTIRIVRRLRRFFVHDIPDWRSGTTVVVLLACSALLTVQVYIQGVIIQQQKAAIAFLLSLLSRAVIGR
jgi:hypothetical protein